MDRTPIVAYIYSCPVNERRAAVDVLRQNGLHLRDELIPATLVLGVEYWDDECPAGAEEVIGEKLIERAPGATFIVWTDPVYEWLGGGMAYAPDLGRFDYDCGSDGKPVFDAKAVLQMLMLEPEDRRRGLGLPWFERIETLRKQLAK